VSRATLWVLGGIFAVVLAICIVGAVLAIATSDEDVDVNLGDDEFQIEDIEARADLVAEDGPLRFADPTGGDRPLIVNHVGDDPAEGWVAVLAIAPGSEGCIVDWDDGAGAFRDCEGQTYPPDGEGLETFPTRIDDDTLFVDLGRGRTTSDTTDTGDDPVITGNG
jgi:hypothetical protein